MDDGGGQAGGPACTGGRRIVFDLTTLCERRHLRPTGIERVIAETAHGLINVQADVMFCHFDRRRRQFRRLDRTAALALLASSERAAPDDQRPRQRVHAKSWLYRQLTRTPRRRLVGRPLIRVLRGVSVRARAAKSLSRRWWDHRPRLRSRAHDDDLVLDASTLYCSLGMDWLFHDLDVVASARAATGAMVVLMIHDLVPIVAPQFSGSDVTGYYHDLLATADVVLVTSDTVAADVKAFARDERIATPRLERLHLSSSLRDLHPVEPAPMPDGSRLAPGAFVLCVGTITIRKNHHLLLDVWEELVEARGATATPTLVVAGAKGWLSEETISRLLHTPTLRGVVHHLPDATDSELAWLYEHCRFTVYPSRSEGWGLPVTESLDFDKVCLVADASSLPEAAEGLGVLLDELDRSAWRVAVERHWDDEQLRLGHQCRIAAAHRRRVAGDGARAIVGLAAGRG